MKKALAIFIAFAMVSSVVFADVADIAVSGFGKLTWGVDLNEDGGSGFNNEAEWKIQIPLLSKKTFSTKSEGDAYAEISIKDAQYIIEGKFDQNDKSASDINKDFEANKGDKKIDGIDAKLVFGAVYMTVYGKPGFKTDNAGIWDPIKADGYNDDDKEGDKLQFEPGFDGFGTKIGYKTDKFDIGVKLASNGNWKTTGAVTAVVGVADDPLTPEDETVQAVAAAPAVPGNSDNEYAFGIDATFTPSDMVTASFTFNNAMWEGSSSDPASSIMSAGAKVVVKPIDGLTTTLALDAGNDYVNVDGDSAWAYDALISAKYKFAEVGMYYATFKGLTPVLGSNGAGYVNQFATVDSSGDPVADASVYFKVMDGGAVENLEASATVMMHEIMSDHADSAIPMAFGVNVGYKVAMGDVNYVKPFANVWGQNCYTPALDDDVMALAYEVGADYGLFTNTVITAKFAAGGTNDNAHEGLIARAASGSDDTDLNDKGTFTLAVKVTY